VFEARNGIGTLKLTGIKASKKALGISNDVGSGYSPSASEST
jgi:hypothetical protein